MIYRKEQGRLFMQAQNVLHLTGILEHAFENRPC